MRIAPLAEVKARFSAYVDQCHDSPVIVTKNGRPTAVIVAVPDDPEELERFILVNTPRFRRLLSSAEARIMAGEGIQHDELWRRVAKRRSPRPRR